MPVPPSVRRVTIRETPPERSAYWAAQRPTPLLPARSGWTWMQVRGNHMWTPLMRLRRWHVSYSRQVFRRPSTLDQAWVSMSIGPWTKTWTVKRGSGMRLDSNRYVSGMVLKLGLSELRIFLQYYAPPELTGESTVGRNSCRQDRYKVHIQ